MSPDQLRLVLDLVAKGGKIAKVARAVGLSRQTIYRLLEYHGETPTAASA